MVGVKCNGYKEIEKDKEKRKKQNNYPGSFHNPEVVQFPCHLQEIFHYNLTRLQLLKHTRKRLLTNKDYKEDCLN